MATSPSPLLGKQIYNNWIQTRFRDGASTSTLSSPLLDGGNRHPNEFPITSLDAWEEERDDDNERTSSSWTSIRLVLTAATFVVLVALGTYLSLESSSPSSVPPIATRAAKIEKCVDELQKDGAPAPSEQTRIAMDWFLTGSGSNVTIPDDSQAPCTWDCEFGQLYALILLRECVSVKDKSWHPERPLKEGLSQVCSSWKRIRCDVHQATITSLNLNHANLSGWLPSVKFAGVTKVFLDNNDGLVGSLPSTLNQLLPNLEVLYLQETSIGGTIPSEVGLLTSLRELLLDRTHLVGSMPSEICALPQLENLHADCKHGPSLDPRVSCDCCTACH